MEVVLADVEVEDTVVRIEDVDRKVVVVVEIVEGVLVPPGFGGFGGSMGGGNSPPPIKGHLIFLTVSRLN